jgi:peptide-methionine (S)-S-oxide reductase
MQDLIRNMPGVLSTVGCSGGDVPNATYRHHGTHAEAVEVVNSSSKFTTTRNRQGNDVGTSYRSATIYVNDAQKHVAKIR